MNGRRMLVQIALAGLILSALPLLAVNAPALAAAPAPHWRVRADLTPTYISPTAGGTLSILATNDGGAPTDGSAVTVTEKLPAGLTVASVRALEQPSEAPVSCTQATNEVTCEDASVFAGENGAGIDVLIKLTAEAGVSTASGNLVTVSGGGASDAGSEERALTVSGAVPAFAFSSGLQLDLLDAAGASDHQAGGHPNAITTTFLLNSISDPKATGEQGAMVPIEDARDVSVDLPAGVVGNPQATPKCPQYLVASGGEQCPTASVVGTIALAIDTPPWVLSGPIGPELAPTVAPIFNVRPEHGFPAQFAFIFAGEEVTLYASLAHTAAGYVVRVTAPKISRLVALRGSSVTFFGDPARRTAARTRPCRLFATRPTAVPRRGRHRRRGLVAARGPVHHLFVVTARSDRV